MDQASAPFRDAGQGFDRSARENAAEQEACAMASLQTTASGAAESTASAESLVNVANPHSSGG
jgi:hypothetical protein